MHKTLFLASILGLAAIGPFAAPASAEDPPAADAERTKWAEHMGDLPFVIGFDKGMKEVEFTGRPPIVFFTADY